MTHRIGGLLPRVRCGIASAVVGPVGESAPLGCERLAGQPWSRQPNVEEIPMTDAVIVSAARTPIGRANKGSLVDVDAFELAEVALSGAIERSGIDPKLIDDLV